MKKSVKECLQEWKVPRHYVGYQYLLDAADLYAQGVPVGWPMLFQIGEKRGPGDVPGTQRAVYGG